PQRRHRCDLHPLHRSRCKTGLDDAVLNAAGVKFSTSLLDDFEAMRQHERRGEAIGEDADEFAGNDGFPAGGGRQPDNTTLTRLDGVYQVGNGADLIRAKDVGHLRPRLQNAISSSMSSLGERFGAARAAFPPMVTPPSARLSMMPCFLSPKSYWPTYSVTR